VKIRRNKTIKNYETILKRKGKVIFAVDLLLFKNNPPNNISNNINITLNKLATPGSLNTTPIVRHAEAAVKLNRTNTNKNLAK